MKKENKSPFIFLTLVFFILISSFIAANDSFTWVLEVFPVIIGIVILVITYRKFRLTDFLYSLLIVHSVILAVGSIYTYAEVPLGFWMQDWFGFTRNHYDRIGHFAQGFFPAILVREILLRLSPLRRGKLFNFIIVSICLAVSAFYELIEFSYTVLIGASAESFLGTQGDVWDAQWDMSFALIGAIISLLILSGIHDRFLKKLTKK
ncbi:MAG: DUF2238 domain-containing protein [Spirochaetes bacterium]|nr:DUF2238 domain-containing protein [Spirochaetota bacterium]